MGLRTIVLLSSLLSFAIEAKQVRKMFVEMTEEKIDGMTFVHELRLIDGKKEEKWQINGRPLAQNEYNQKILEAEFEERRKQREEDYQKQVRLAQLRVSMAEQATKKLLAHTVQEIEQGLEQLNRHELHPYLVYNSATFNDELELSNLKDHMLAEVRQLLTDEFDPQQAQHKLRVIEAYPQKIANLFEHTVQNAINHCDDPKKLKNWLQMLS